MSVGGGKLWRGGRAINVPLSRTQQRSEPGETQTFFRKRRLKRLKPREAHLRPGVNHLVFDFGRVRRPRYEHQLVPLTPVLGDEVQVEHAVAALGGRQGGAEVIVGLGLVSKAVDHDLRVVLDLVHEVSVVVWCPVQLERVERLDRLIVNSHSGSLLLLP